MTREQAWEKIQELTRDSELLNIHRESHMLLFKAAAWQGDTKEVDEQRMRIIECVERQLDNFATTCMLVGKFNISLPR